MKREALPMRAKELAELDGLLDRYDQLTNKEQKRLDFLQRQKERALDRYGFYLLPKSIVDQKKLKRRP